MRFLCTVLLINVSYRFITDLVDTDLHNWWGLVADHQILFLSFHPEQMQTKNNSRAAMLKSSCIENTVWTLVVDNDPWPKYLIWRVDIENQHIPSFNWHNIYLNKFIDKVWLSSAIIDKIGLTSYKKLFCEKTQFTHYHSNKQFFGH